MITPRVLLTSCAVLLAPLASELRADLTLSPSMTFVQEGPVGGPVQNNPALASNGAVPFSSGDLGVVLGLPFHLALNINDGVFGNANSWIGDSPNAYVGVALPGEQTIAGFAFGRDNLGDFGDRDAGLYTIQFTLDANPAGNHAGALWNTIGTVQIGDGAGVVTNAALRHQFNINTPVSATGFRLIAPDGAALDELELFTTASPGIAAIATNSVPGFSVSWDGNDADNFSSAALVPDNLALASNAAVAISSGDLGPQIMVPFHVASNLNDGLYGNANSWIGGDGAPAPFHAGVLLDDLYEITSIAWGRDNGLDDPADCCGGQLRDRSMGTYTIQRTLDGSIWETVGSVDFNYGQDDILGSGFTPYYRHEFELSDGDGGILALGMRVLVPTTGIGGGTAIDEIELYGALPVPEPGSAALLAGGMLSLLVGRRRRA